jgi:hypothetical protein
MNRAVRKKKHFFELFYLDPHFTQSTIDIGKKSLETKSYHFEQCLSMHETELDPSLALGFYIPSIEFLGGKFLILSFFFVFFFKKTPQILTNLNFFFPRKAIIFPHFFFLFFFQIFLNEFIEKNLEKKVGKIIKKKFKVVKNRMF